MPVKSNDSNSSVVCCFRKHHPETDSKYDVCRKPRGNIGLKWITTILNCPVQNTGVQSCSVVLLTFAFLTFTRSPRSQLSNYQIIALFLYICIHLWLIKF